MTLIFNTMRHTPSWVWVVLLLLIYSGLKARRPRRQTQLRLLLLPAIFLVWGLVSIFLALPAWGAGLVGFAAAFVLCGALSWRLNKDVGYYDASGGQYVRAGTGWPLVVMLLTFAGRYYCAIQLAWEPTLATSAVFCALSGIVGGFSAGFFAAGSGRLLMQRYYPVSADPA
ncbi:hypothetical protein FJU30_10290 [Affinibrenneria salicis]|uniref:DUF1453 domain-containing protein n=1 Tax=Affinibrenneria salicis TaxID=2590031 RepID=A0A5J5G1I5_9GAMM|nr:DUF6622 family protein [Affinibrenneria salicis]KAA9000606.1 hypothetical protein FJU30_10290 [Affinibrenneria salicis]